MSHWFSIDRLNTHISAVIFKPIVGDGSKTFAAFTTKLLAWVCDVEPSICGKNDLARKTAFFERCQRKETSLIFLSFFVLVSFNFFRPIVVVGEGPVDLGIVVDHAYFNCVARVASPVGRGLAEAESKEEG